MRNLTLTIHFCDISQSFVSATKYENTSNIPSDVMTIITTADVGLKTSKVVMIHNIRGLFNSLPVSE
jgi:hypothetical protein